MNQMMEYTGGLLPENFLTFVQVSAILGFIATLALCSVLVYKGVEKFIGAEKAKEYRWLVLVVDIVVLFIFIFIYLAFF